MQKKFAQSLVVVKLWKKKHWGPLDPFPSKQPLVKNPVNRGLNVLKK